MLKGKTVLVTGAAKGIGKAIALCFAEQSANLVLNYRSNEPKELMEEIRAKGASCVAVQGDIGQFSFAETLVKTAKETFGSLDVLVNNAGITKDGLLMRMTEQDFDSVIETNLKGTFNMVRFATPLMLKQKSGTIVNISSVVGVSGNIGQANYAASKAGIIGLTKATAKELASRGITCNAVAPGFIETDMAQQLPQELQEKIKDNIPLKRFGTAQEVARVVLFLALNPYITGQVIQVDGGMVM